MNKIEISKENLAERFFKESMKELEEFYGVEWNEDRPRITCAPDRKTIDGLKGEKTEDWVVGWVGTDNNIYVLSAENFEKESQHKFSEKGYKELIKHELSHCFYTHLFTNGKFIPIWLNEGLAVYTSGEEKQKVIKFENFLKYFSYQDKDTYAEVRFVIELLIKNWGKENLLKLLRGIKDIETESDFNKLFESIYGEAPNYDFFNKLLDS